MNSNPKQKFLLQNHTFEPLVFFLFSCFLSFSLSLILVLIFWLNAQGAEPPPLNLLEINFHHNSLTWLRDYTFGPIEIKQLSQYLYQFLLANSSPIWTNQATLVALVGRPRLGLFDQVLVKFSFPKLVCQNFQDFAKC